MKEPALISSMSKFNPKHDLLVDMTMPVCQYVEKMPQINRWLRHINHELLLIDNQSPLVQYSNPPIHSLINDNKVLIPY